MPTDEEYVAVNPICGCGEEVPVAIEKTLHGLIEAACEVAGGKLVVQASHETFDDHGVLLSVEPK